MVPQKEKMEEDSKSSSGDLVCTVLLMLLCGSLELFLGRVRSRLREYSVSMLPCTR